MNIVDKLRAWQRGEVEWGQEDMVREVLEALVDGEMPSRLNALLSEQIEQLEKDECHD